MPDTHPLGAGVLGRWGTPVASWLMNESDLLLVVGASFANHTGIAPYKPIVQIDDAPAAIGRFHPVQVGVLGDATVTLRRCSTGSVGPPPWTSAATSPPARRSGARRRPAGRSDDRGRGVSSAAVFAALSAHCPTDAVIAVDVGNHAYSFGRYFESAGQPVLMSGYLGSIGFGYPAAMGAWAADPTRPVVAVTGDGGFGQYLAELTTAVKYRIPVKHVLLDNGALGKISKEQLAGQYAGLADLPRQPRLRRVRPALRRRRHPGAPRRGARRRHEGAVRRRRPGAAARARRRRAGVTMSTGLVVVLAVSAGVPLLLGLLPALRLLGALLRDRGSGC